MTTSLAASRQMRTKLTTAITSEVRAKKLLMVAGPTIQLSAVQRKALKSCQLGSTCATAKYSAGCHVLGQQPTTILPRQNRIYRERPAASVTALTFGVLI